MPDAQRLRREYLEDICEAISAYLAEGMEAQISSDAAGDDALAIRFTLAEGSRYQALLREQMAKRLPRET